ncbi:hypothetical protein T492DRAFT_881718, partial [Pavlovales sp. CCMP2436]
METLVAHGASDVAQTAVQAAEMMPKCWISYLKKSGVSGGKMPITSSLVLGRGVECDVAIRLPDVELKHAQLTVDDKGTVWLENFGKPETTTLNGAPVEQRMPVKHEDEMHIRGRIFRFTIEDPASALPAQAVKSSPKRSPLFDNRAAAGSPRRLASAHVAGGQENASAARALGRSTAAALAGPSAAAPALREAPAKDGEPSSAKPAKASGPFVLNSSELSAQLKALKPAGDAQAPAPKPLQPVASSAKRAESNAPTSSSADAMHDELSMAMHKRRHLLSPANSDDASPKLTSPKQLSSKKAAAPPSQAPLTPKQAVAAPEAAASCPVPTPRSLRPQRTAVRTPTSVAPQRSGADSKASSEKGEEEDDATVDIADLLNGMGAGASPVPLLSSNAAVASPLPPLVRAPSPASRAEPERAREPASPALAATGAPTSARRGTPSAARRTPAPPSTSAEAASRYMLETTTSAVKQVDEALRSLMPKLSPSPARKPPAAVRVDSAQKSALLQAAIDTVRQPTPLKDPSAASAARAAGNVRRSSIGSSVGGSPNLILFDQTLYGPLGERPVLMTPAAAGSQHSSLLAAFAAVSSASPQFPQESPQLMPSSPELLAPSPQLMLASPELAQPSPQLVHESPQLLHPFPASQTPVLQGIAQLPPDTLLKASPRALRTPAARAGDDEPAASAKRPVAKTPVLQGIAQLPPDTLLKASPRALRTPAVTRAGDDDELAASAKRPVAMTPVLHGIAQLPPDTLLKA